MEVTQQNFESLLPRIEEALTTCHFCAIDTEFTGLSLANPRREDVLDDAEQRYARVRTSAQNFLIMQFGLATFHWNCEEGCYQAQTFNFYTFPRPNGGTDIRFTCQASSLDFLREHGFDFNKFIYSGIPYITLEQLQWETKFETQVPREPIVLRKEEDRAFVAQQMENVRRWVDSTEAKEVDKDDLDSEPATLILDPSNSYLRAALCQQLEQEYGKSDFFIERLSSAGTRKSSLKLTRATSEAVAAQESEVAAKRQRQLERAIGFANVMQALTSCNKPVVGHNMLLDLAYLYQQFVGYLPPTVDEFRQQVRHLFPGGVYDTKYLAEFFPLLLPSTSLEELHTSLAPRSNHLGVDVSSEGIAESTGANGVTDTHAHLSRVELLKVDHADQFDRYRSTENVQSHFHEAGYDAYMTGTVFIWLAKLFEALSSSSTLEKGPLQVQVVQEYRDRVYVMRSDLPYLPLQGPIPVQDHSSLFMLTSTNGLPLPSRDEIMLRFSTINCKIDRMLWMNQMSCYVTLADGSQAPVVIEAIREAGWHLMFSPFRSTGELTEPLVQR